MNQTLQQIFTEYFNLRNSQPNFKISKKSFIDEKISKVSLNPTTFEELNLKNIQLNGFGCNFSSFRKCSFEDCIFDNVYLRDTEWINCSFKNCTIIKSDLDDNKFVKTTFENCKIHKQTRFGVTCFKRCNFIETTFEDIYISPIVLINSKFSNANLSVELKEKFFLFHVIATIDEVLNLPPI